jgi:hypothetical protein
LWSDSCSYPWWPLLFCFLINPPHSFTTVFINERLRCWRPGRLSPHWSLYVLMLA